ncbi:DNA ligase D [Acidovorax sp. BL-A-41-H1]|uniref:DNA ligase D n=1 Tax=Acidovorax sp. BL-A-41-H1 TaxID=3421102 RepID=UPI003F7A593E
MRVATWNINHIHKRLQQLLDWLARTRPDVVALQELKCTAADFPTDALEQAGYHSIVVGQRTWNGVALLSREIEPLPVVTSLPDDPADKEARYVEAAIDGLLFACLYLPNGNPRPGPKFDYKMRWFERLESRARELVSSGYPAVLLGDWNVVPTDHDIYRPDTWREDALLQPEPRAAFARMLAQGWTDALAHAHPGAAPFTFWDYRRKRWERDAGLRIDHILVSGALAVEGAGVDREERGKESPSDHAPVWAQLKPRKPAARSKAPATNPSSRAKAPARLTSRTAAPAPLSAYNAKRDFSRTAEPAGIATAARGARKAASGGPLQFVIQKHWASRLHYDFRLEWGGVMLSWAVPKGPSFDPTVKSMAIQVEDHPLAYNTFEGSIPKGEYGAGTVLVWDRGTWEPVGDPDDGLAVGKLVFRLHGEKLAGVWELVRISRPGEKKQDQWMLFKKRGDAWARPLAEYDVIKALPDSVVQKPLGPVEQREPRGDPPNAAKSGPATSGKKARLPARLEPQLATLVSSVPPGDWIIETKFDGYRVLARVDGDDVRIFTRNGHDWTARLAGVAAGVKALGLTSGWLDGEIVVLNDAGVPDFNRLQNAIDSARTAEIVMFVFDVPFLGGMDLRAVPLAARRGVLHQLLTARGNTHIRFSEAFDAAPAQLLGAACQMGLEGVIVKRPDAPYVSGRTETWMKLKCQHRQEFVVLGFTQRSGAAREVGSLMLGYHDNGTLRAAGSVGTGWDSATGKDLHARLTRLETPHPPVAATELQPGRWSRRRAGEERWVRPSLVVEVAFGEWTPDSKIRHAVFRGIRTDKPAEAIVREEAVQSVANAAPTPQPTPAPAKTPTSSVRITHADRVIDPTTGLRKLDLVHYYESVARWMLPHLKDRPISLVRAPSGITGQQFFQKHPETRMPGMRELDPALWPEHEPLLAADSADALISAAQMNVVEFHTWNSTTRRIDQPDRFVLDLDPGEGVTWPMLQEAAELTRVMLTELGLESWLKTSGGKGLHVVVPITPTLAFPEVKAFTQALVRHMARVIPSRFVAVMGGKNRVGKIFIDYLRNGHGQTTVCAFSARARPGMGVSMPVGWGQLRELEGGAQWTIATAREYLSFQQDDPWKGFWKKRQYLAQGMKLLKE